ncbi:MAG: GDSL-type esterase/lipase family protein [bacterium]
MNRKNKLSNYGIVFTIFLFFATLINAQTAVQDSLLYLKNPNYLHELGLLEVYKTKQADIVMLGNSITHGANWNELLGRNGVVERGIPSDIVDGFYARIGGIIKLKPKLCFIMGGINDIYNWTPVEKIFEKYVKILTELKKNNIKPIVQSTLYVGVKWKSYADRNREVAKLNKMLMDYAKKNVIDYVDLNKKMSTKNILNNDITIDGLHLNGKGFGIWALELEKILRKYNF